MASRAREIAEAWADNALSRLPVVAKSAGTRDSLIKAAMPAAKAAVRIEKAIGANQQTLSVLRSAHDLSERAISREAIALERAEAMLQMMTEVPQTFYTPRNQNRILSDFIPGSRPVTKAESNGHRPDF